MGKQVSLEQAAQMLLNEDDLLILAHKNPDGDTLGSCYALCRGLRFLGKRVRVACSDPTPRQYQSLLPGEEAPQFEPRFIVAADIADTQLMGPGLEPYKNRVDLCIDHHPSNTGYAAATLLRADAAATAEIMLDVLLAMGVTPDRETAACLYTGLATDTGCFRFSNTTAHTHRAAARLIELGADSAAINRRLFSTKTQSRIAVEREVYSTIEYHCGGRCALICISRSLLERTGADEAELDGLSSIPCQIEGVEVGVTLREREGGCKVSLRTAQYINASSLCARLGGGGHARAAGCFVPGSLEQAKEAVLGAVEQALAQWNPENH